MTILGTATGAAVALGSTLATGGIAFAAYGAVAKTVIGNAATAATAVQAAQNRYNASITAGAKQSTAYLAEQKAINLAYAQMSPAQIALSRQLGDLSNQWQGVEKSLTPVIAMSVQPWLAGITSAAKFAKPVVTGVSQAVSSLGSTFAGLVNLPAFATFAKFIGTEGTDVIASGGGALMNFFHGFLILLPQVKPLIDDVDHAISGLGSSFLTWSQSDAPRRDITAFLSWLHDNGPVVGHLLLAIGAALKNLGGGLLEGPAGADEIRLLTGFFGMISRLPPSFVQPVADLAASLLLISKFGVGRKVISIGVNLVGTAFAKLWNLLTPGGSIDFTGKFSGAAAMQAAADTMVTASVNMQKAADTMVGADAGGGGVGGLTTQGAEDAAGGAAGGAAAAESAAATKAESGILGLVGGLLSKVNPALWGLALSGDSGPQSARTSRSALGITDSQTSPVKVIVNWSGASPAEARSAIADVKAGTGFGNLNALHDTPPADIAAIVRFTAANTAAAKAVGLLGSAEFAGKVPMTQFSGFLTAAGTSSLKAKTLTDAYTLAIQHNGATSQAAQQVRAQMISDFMHQGLSAQQANKLVDTYTDSVLANGSTTAAKAKVRAQLISDFEAAGDTAKAAAAKVDTLIGQIANVRSKAVSLSVKASGSFTITDQSVSAGPGHKIVGGVATGGLINGPGTGTSDTAGLFALSNKEYVHNAAAVDYYGTAFMDAVNQQRLPKMAGGGLAGTFAGNAAGLGAFDTREWHATQSMVESADAAAAASALRKSIAAARAQLEGGLGSATGGPLAILKYAQSFLGTPYVWGGTTPGGWDCCIIGSMQVQTNQGPKEIRDIRAGDVVYSWNDGKLAASRVLRRSAPRHQQTYRLRTIHREIVASGNHPFLTLRQGDTVPRPPSGLPDLPAALSRPPGQQPHPVSSEQVRDLYLGGYSLSEIAAHLGIAVMTVSRRLDETGTPRRPRGASAAGVKRPKAWTAEWVNLEDLRRDDIIVTLRSLPDDAPEPADALLADKRFLWLLGLAFGDGALSHARANRVDLCVFGELREETQRRLDDFCGKRGSETDKHGVYLFSEPLATGFRRFGMDAKSTDRVLPRELWSLPHGHIQAFLDGYTAADGHRVKRASDPALSYKAANRRLIKDVRNLHLVIGHNVTRVREMKRTRPIVIKGVEVRNARSLWTFEAYETGRKQSTAGADLLHRPGIAEMFPPDSNFAPQKVTSIEPMEVEDTYDIMVEDTHNFVAEGLVVHNSGYTSWVYHHFGIPAPRTSQEQQLWAQPSGDQPAALVFFYGTDGTASHVGLSIGDGTMMNAADPALGTLISSTGGNSGFGVPPDAATGARGKGPGLSPRIRSFDSGGWVLPGITLMDNRTGGPEHLTRDSGGRNQGATLSDVAGLISRLIGAVYDNAGMTADGVADAIGGAATRSAHRAMYSPR